MNIRFCFESFRIRLLHDRCGPDTQSHQPIHRQRQRGRRRQRNDHSRAQQSQQRDESQRRRARVRSRRQALRCGWRERQQRQRANAGQPARQDPAPQRRRHNPDRQPVLQHGDRHRIAPSGRSACAIPSRSRSDRHGTEFFINDVGQSAWEEINDGIAGSNYGWPTTEGHDDEPIVPTRRGIAYGHTGGTCAITGGAFYSPQALQFPVDYVGDYFFADYCGGWIRKLDVVDEAAVRLRDRDFMPRRSQSVGRWSVVLPGARNGFVTGVVYRIEYGNQAPTITQHPSSQTVRARRVGDVQRASVLDDDAALSMAAQHRQYPGCDRAGLHDL